jgi:hypothetical protein
MTKKYRNLTSVCCAAALFALVSTGCSSDKSTDTADNSTSDSNSISDSSNTDSDDTTSSEYYITFTDSGVETNLSDAEIDGTKITITSPIEDDGVDVSGDCDNGQIYVDVDKETYPDAKVILNLKNLNLSNTETSPVYVASIGDECEICVKKDTVNTISDGTDYTNDDSDSGAIYSKEDLKFTGKGSLTVNGNADCGIVSKDSLKIYNGNITVNSEKTGIKGKDNVIIAKEDSDDNSDLVLEINTNDGDGIKSTNSDEEDKGYVTINGGTITINAQGDGIQAATVFTMNDGTVNINAEGENDNSDDSDSSDNSTDETSDNTAESVESQESDNSAPDNNSIPQGGGDFDPANAQNGEMPSMDFSNMEMPSGDFDFSDFENGEMPSMDFSDMEMPSGDFQNTPDNNAGFGGGGAMGGGFDNDISTSGNKGIKAGTDLIITNGTINVTSNGHAIHSSGTGEINGGAITISSESGKGISVHGNLTIGDTEDTSSSPEITINKATEGIESKAVMTINSGDINITYANDDGLNTGGTESDDHSLIINGGNIYIDMTETGDGIDSNGTITFNGGNIIVNGPTGGGDSSIDSESGVYYNGATVVAVGSSTMLSQDCFSVSDSTNGHILSTSAGISNGDTITVLDSDNNVILSYTFNNSNSSTSCDGLVISSSDITTDGEYTVYKNGTYTAGNNDENENIYTGGTFDNSSAEEITQSDSTGFGGGFGGGGAMGGFGGGGQGNQGSQDDGQMMGGGNKPDDKFAGNDSNGQAT